MHAAPRVAIRVDASATMGTGHLRRCLSLAQALAAAGAEPGFVVRRLDAVAPQLLATAGLPVQWLPTPAEQAPPAADAPPHAAWAGVPGAQDAADTVQALTGWRPDWLVLDHYAFDARWHRVVRTALGCRLLVIDDTADRTIDADALLDHNWAADHAAKYADRLAQPPGLWLCGPRFALLAPVYRRARRCTVRPEVRSLGIFMGGTDPDGASARVLAACREAGHEGAIEVVSSTASPHLPALRAACAADAQARLTLDEPDLAAFFARHDLQVGAGGGATWERCCIGAPTVALALAANQSVVVPALDHLGALRAASLPGLPNGADTPPLARVLHRLMADTAARQALAARAAELVDGRGAERVALGLLRDHLQLRPATQADAALLHGWRNHPTVRAVSGRPEAIERDAHGRWLERVIADPNRWLWVAEVGALPVGSIRFDRIDGGQLEVSLYLDPNLPGLGLGTRLLRAGEERMHALLDAPLQIDATVVAGNRSSQRLFQAGGYQGGPQRFHKSIPAGPAGLSPTPP